MTIIFLTVAWFGCEDRPATQVMISVATDLEAKDVGLVRLAVERQEPNGVFVPHGVPATWSIKNPTDGDFSLPGSVVAFAGGDEGARVRISVSALRGGDPMAAVVQRRAVLSLPREQTLFLRMGLTSRCGEAADCSNSETCVEGRCLPQELAADRLPAYTPGSRAEMAFPCDSGTSFLATATGEALKLGGGCPGDQVCSEGTCYRPEVFSARGLPPAGEVTVVVQVGTPAGTPVMGAQLRLEDGPISLVRTLRGSTTLAAPAGSEAASDEQAVADPAVPGLFRVKGKAERLTHDLRLTVTAPGFAPQVLSVPYKANVAEYRVPVVLFPLVEHVFASGGARTLELMAAGGHKATLEVGGDAETRVRFALMDPGFGPGLGVSGSTLGLLHARAVLYLENVGAPELPANTKIVVSDDEAAPPAGGMRAFALDLQGRWHRRERAAGQAAALDGLAVTTSGFWSVGAEVGKTTCVRGNVKGPGTSETPCTGVRVRLQTAAGTSSFDSTGSKGEFCGAAVPGEAVVVAVGNSSGAILVEARSTNPSCDDPESCFRVGDLHVDAEEECTGTPAVTVPASP
jgi:hypothetical protein